MLEIIVNETRIVHDGLQQISMGIFELKNVRKLWKSEKLLIKISLRLSGDSCR